MRNFKISRCTGIRVACALSMLLYYAALGVANQPSCDFTGGVKGGAIFRHNTIPLEIRADFVLDERDILFSDRFEQVTR